MTKTLAAKDSRLTGMNNEPGQALEQRSQRVKPVTPLSVLTNRRTLRKSR